MTDTDLAVRSSDSSASSASSPAKVRTSSGPVDTSAIIGWGVDADPDNDPTYSYRDRSADDHSGKWARPAQQEPDVELLQSIEHKQRPAVFGTASPPRGLSGLIRRGAFTYSESHWLHWLMLMGADRIDMVEGLVTDLARAKIPNIPREMGVGAEWKHNKKGLAAKIGIAAAIAGGIYAWSKFRSRDEAERGPAARRED